MTEEWRPVIGNPRYEVSSLGRVRRAPQIIAPRSKRGYLRVTLGSGTRKKKDQRIVHQLVAEAFIGSCPPGKQVNHKSGDKSDNRPENLEYVTASENIRHSFRLALSRGRHGTEHRLAKLTEDQVKEIRSALRRWTHV